MRFGRAVRKVPCKRFNQCPSNQPNSPTNPCILNPNAKHFKGGLRSCHPKLTPTSRTDRGLAELAPRCVSFLAIGRCKHSKGIVHFPSVAAVRSIPKASFPRQVWGAFLCRIGSTASRPSVSIRSNNALPTSLYLAFPTPSLLHSTGRVSPCQPTIRCKLPDTPH